MIEFFIPGIPVAKARPKLSTIGGFARAYTPAKTRKYEEAVALFGKQSIKKPLECAVRLELTFTLPIPLSTPKKRRISGPHTKRPDLDNMIKSVTDGLNGIAYLDDCQVYEITARKLTGDEPGVLVRVFSLVA